MNKKEQALERMLNRDALTRKSGAEPPYSADVQLLEFILENKLLDNENARRWIIERGASDWSGPVRKVIEALILLLELGRNDDALEIFKKLVGLGADSSDSFERRRAFFAKGSFLFYQLKDVFEKERLLFDRIDSWGEALVQLQSQLVEDDRAIYYEQLRLDRSDLMDGIFASEFYDRRYKNKRTFRIVETIETCLEECVMEEEAQKFRSFSDQLVKSKLGFPNCQPRAALFDFLSNHDSTWHEKEAIRLLLSHDGASERFTSSWDRLLWSVLGSESQIEHASRFAEKYRNADAISEEMRLGVFHDLWKFGVLTEVEICQVDTGLEENRVYRVADPRERFKMSEPFFEAGNETWEEGFTRKWPVESERELVEVVVAKPPSEESDELKRKRLLDKIEAVAALANVERDTSFNGNGWIMEWSSKAIADLREVIEIDLRLRANAESIVFIDALNKRFHGWRGQFESALKWLDLSSPPESDADEFPLGVPSGDLFASSFNFLDELCAVTSDLEDEKEMFYAQVAKNWNGWSLYSQGLALCRVRRFHWVVDPSMRECLRITVLTCNDSRVVSAALSNLMACRASGVVELTSSILNRVDSFPNSHELVYYVGKIIGYAIAQAEFNENAHEEMLAVSNWFDDLKSNHSLEPEVWKNLISAVLNKLNEVLIEAETKLLAQANFWASQCIWGLSEWIRLSDKEDDTTHLPNSPVRFIRQNAWSRDVAETMLTRLSDTLALIVRQGGLGNFFSIHFELVRNTENSQLLESIDALPVLAFLDDQCRIDICLASTERLVEWSRAQKTTNDLAYGSSISGHDTSKLIECCIDYCDDKNFTRRELSKCVDLLSELEDRRISNELRIKLRNS